MLQPNDLERYISLHQRAEELGPLTGNDNDAVIKGNGLYPAEIYRLKSSLHILTILDELPSSLVTSLDHICEINRQMAECAGLDDSDTWIRAIRVNLGKPHLMGDNWHKTISRQTQVAMACRNLRLVGHQIEVSAYGPNVSIEVQRKVSNEVDKLISKMGEKAIPALFSDMASRGLFHEGMWLFGTRIPNIMEIKSPSLPIGWLLSIAVRHSGKRCKALPKDWERIQQLATDLAAAFDCERYSMFEQMNIAPSEFWRSLVDSLHWREMFSLPQAPANVLKCLLEALRAIDWPESSSAVKTSVIMLTSQCVNLISRLSNEQPSKFTAATIKTQFPLVAQFGMIDVNEVNRGYDAPMAISYRNHDRHMLFKAKGGRIYAMPKSLTAAAACHVIISRIWQKLEIEVAKEVVGNALEKMVEIACSDKATNVIPKRKYSVGKSILEIDLATTEEDSVVLFEIKAKSLTTEARSGDMTSYVSDYTNSYLRILDQLTRHEENLREGNVSLLGNNQDKKQLRPLKIALSPLSFGPICDPNLANAMLRSITNVKFTPVQQDPLAEKKWGELNGLKDKILNRIYKLSDKNEEGQADILRYLRTIQWLDMGQLIYLLEKSPSVSEAVRPFCTIFSSQDFWMEMAFLDRMGIGSAQRKSTDKT